MNENVKGCLGILLIIFIFGAGGFLIEYCSNSIIESREKEKLPTTLEIYSRPLSHNEQITIVKGKFDWLILGNASGSFRNEKDDCNVSLYPDINFQEESAIEIDCFTMILDKRITSIECLDHIAKLRLKIHNRDIKYTNSHVPTEWKNCKEFKINYREFLDK